MPATQLSRDVRRAPPGSLRLVLDSAGHPARLGHGGNRGSIVYLVEAGGERRALKMCIIGHGELAFSVAVQRAAARAELDSGAAGPAAPTGISSIAVPLYAVDRRSFESRDAFGAVAPATMMRLMGESAAPDEVLVGIVMPLYDCSLQRLLTAPSVDVACHPRDTPVTPGSPTPAWAMKHPDSLDRMHGMDETSTSSDDGNDGPRLPFHIAPRQRRVGSLVVIAAILERVVAGVSAIRDALPHDICHECLAPVSTEILADPASAPPHQPQELPKSTGFAHQDLRADNVLLSRSGNVVLCDFELVAHVTAEGTLVQPLSTPTFDGLAGASTSTASSFVTNSRRLLPTAFHAPEGPNRPNGDAWLIGLLALELFTGVTPIIKTAVAFDDFGDGPLLTVDPVGGIGWPTLRSHIHRRVRPFPSSEEVTSGAAAGYMDPAIANYCCETGGDAFATLHTFSQHFESFLQGCLANDPEQRLTPAELARSPLFSMLRELTGNRPQSAIRAWVNFVGSSASSSPSRVPLEEASAPRSARTPPLQPSTE